MSGNRKKSHRPLRVAGAALGALTLAAGLLPIPVSGQDRTPPTGAGTVPPAAAPTPETWHLTANSDIEVSPRRIRPGETVNISITLRNQGPLVARSQGPSPGTVYTQGETYRDRGLKTLRSDRYGVAMTLSGPRGHEWPYRWGLGGDLLPGKTRRVTYPLRLTKPGIYTIFVGVAAGREVRELGLGQLVGIEVMPEGRAFRTQPPLIGATPPTRITVNGRDVDADQRPVFYKSPLSGTNLRIMVPIRFVSEELGARVRWDSAERIATIERGGQRILLRPGTAKQIVNGRTVTADARLRIINGRTMVPVRFISEHLGGSVNWDNRTRTVAITMPERGRALTAGR